MLYLRYDTSLSLAFAVAKNIFCELVLAVTISFLKLSIAAPVCLDC